MSGYVWTIQNEDLSKHTISYIKLNGRFKTDISAISFTFDPCWKLSLISLMNKKEKKNPFPFPFNYN